MGGWCFLPCSGVLLPTMEVMTPMEKPTRGRAGFGFCPCNTSACHLTTFILHHLFLFWKTPRWSWCDSLTYYHHYDHHMGHLTMPKKYGRISVVPSWGCPTSPYLTSLHISSHTKSPSMTQVSSSKKRQATLGSKSPRKPAGRKEILAKSTTTTAIYILPIRTARVTTLALRVQVWLASLSHSRHIFPQLLLCTTARNKAVRRRYPVAYTSSAGNNTILLKKALGSKFST